MSRGTKLCIYFNFYSLYNGWKEGGRSFTKCFPGARFSSFPRLFGCISGDTVLFVSSKPKMALQARKFSGTFEKRVPGPNSFCYFRETGLWPVSSCTGIAKYKELSSKLGLRLVERKNYGGQRTSFCHCLVKGQEEATCSFCSINLMSIYPFD